jgi:mRNA interferase MazF
LKKGDIYFVELGSVDGREQSGFRPAVLVTKVISNMAVIIPLTTREGAKRFKEIVCIDRSEENGLSEDSIALVFQIRAIDSRRLKRKLGSLEERYVEKLNNIMKEMFL